MELESRKLLLRPFLISDATSLYIIASDPEVTRYMTWKAHRTMKDSEESIRGPLSSEENYAIILKKSGELIGNISLNIGSGSELPLTTSEASIGCWLGKRYWGNRYIEDAYKLIEKRAKELNLSKLYWNHHQDNLASAKAAKRCGFKLEPHYAATIKWHGLEVPLVVNSKTLRRD
ncbi:MAG: GNAT family N-acetyltransferase [Bacillota bacterium]|nr:GNAT family N-acetyltransferase [Bacillota bacterium]